MPKSTQARRAAPCFCGWLMQIRRACACEAAACGQRSVRALMHIENKGREKWRHRSAIQARSSGKRPSGKHRHQATDARDEPAANVFDTTNKHATKSALCLPMICLINAPAKHLIQIANSDAHAAKKHLAIARLSDRTHTLAVIERLSDEGIWNG